jgi:hypothetical protein
VPQPSQQAAAPAVPRRGTGAPAETVYWRVEGSLVNLSAVRPVAFFTWNAHSFSERWLRRGGLLALALVRPLLYSLHRKFATRVLHALLRGISRDRLDLLGEEYFDYRIKPRLRADAVALLQQELAAGRRVVLVSQGLEHVMRPLARHLGVKELVCNRLEFRDLRATGRLRGPVVRPRGALALILSGKPDGRVGVERLLADLGLAGRRAALDFATGPAERQPPARPPRLVRFDPARNGGPGELSVRRALTGKNILVIGVTGFIGKVWLAKLLDDVPEVGRVFLLIRRQRSTTALRRFEKIVAESPVFDGLAGKLGERLGAWLAERVEVVKGDVTAPGLGLEPAVRARLEAELDLIVNSAGLTDFNPDLRDALATNVTAVGHLLDFQRGCRRAAMLHLSTCYVVGQRDGRVAEELARDYTPARVAGFDAEEEIRALEAIVREADARAESEEVTEELRREALQRARPKSQISDFKSPVSESKSPGAMLEEHVRRYRIRWLRSHLIDAGMRRAQQFGWPNTYTFTKSLGESLIARRGAGLPIAVVRPSIVESSIAEPFRGWNEGVGTSAPLAYLLGTYFRQLPSNERKCLDIIPVDVVSRGMMLIAAALVSGRAQPLYQLATSVRNPCDMRRSIELTSLAHRKHYRGQGGLEAWLRARMDSIPVSKRRYRLLSAPRQRALLRGLNRLLSPLPWKPQALIRRERNLERVEKIIELYEPFILHNDHVFECRNAEWLSAALIAEERERFAFDPAAVDWWEYWIDIHVPALRRWCYPLIEGRSLETPPPPPVRLAASAS